MRYLFFLVAGVFGLAGTAHGASAVSLREAIERALKHDYALNAARHERAAAEADLAISRSRYLPRISLEESAVATNSPTRAFMFKLDQGRFALTGDLNNPDATGDFSTSLSLEMPLLDFSIGRGVEASKAEEQRRSYSFEREREEVAFRALESFLAVQQAKARLKAAEQAIDDAREHVRLAVVREDTGIGLKADELRARTFLAEREMELIKASNDLRLSRLRLSRTTGGKPGATIDISESLTPFTIQLQHEDLVPLALKSRHELYEAGSVIERADAGVAAARAAYLPKLYGNVAYQMNDRDIPFGRDNDSWSVGAVLRWELFDGFQRSHEITRAREKYSAAREMLELRKADIALEVEEKYLRREEALKQLEVARLSVVDAEEAVRLVTKRFDNSLATVVETLDAQSALNFMRTKLVDAEIEATRASALIWHAAGIFLREVMK